MTKLFETHRRESGLVEHVCEHGIGHPAWGSARWMEDHAPRTEWGVHGCDGCCNNPEWQIQDLREAVEVSNRIIAEQHNAIHALSERLQEYVDDSEIIRTAQRKNPKA